MTAHHSLANVAALVGEPTRAAILLALLDGRALPAGELAREAGLSAAATSLHLSKLTEGGLLVVRSEGRHRYYRLASDDVAHALEALGVIATKAPPARSLSPDRAALRVARTCYDHLAGEIAVALATMLERRHILRGEGERAYAITRAGARWFAETMHIDVRDLANERRQVARRCLDWTERRPHVAGSLGAAILERLVDERWVVRTKGARVVRVTARGEAGFSSLGLVPTRVEGVVGGARVPV